MSSNNQYAARLEIIDDTDRILASYALRREAITIGRSFTCDVYIDDPHLAAQHCSLFLDGQGRVQVVAMPSLNKVRIEGSQTIGAVSESFDVGDYTILTLGNTRARIRIQDQTKLAPEIALAANAQGARSSAASKQAPKLVSNKLSELAYDSPSWVKMFALLALIYVIELIGHYARLTGEFKIAAVLSSMVGLALFVGAWTAGWSILSRIFSGAAKFKGHLWIALCAILISSLWNEVLDLLGFGFLLRQIDLLDTVSRIFVATVACYFHLKLISTERLFHKALGLGSMFVVGFGIIGLVQFDQLKRMRQSSIYGATKPSAFELKPARSLDQMIEQFNAEKTAIDIQRKEKPPESSDFSLFDDD